MLVKAKLLVKQTLGRAQTYHGKYSGVYRVILQTTTGLFNSDAFIAKTLLSCSVKPVIYNMYGMTNTNRVTLITKKVC